MTKASEPDTPYDVVVIGAGSGGLTAATGFAKVGKRVLLVEREHMGGECTNTGCVPSKALLHHAKTYHTASQIAGTSTQSETYRQTAFSYVRNTVAEILAEEQPEHFEEQGITVIWGEAHFVEPCVISVDDTRYRFKTAVIAAGSSPRLLDVPGLSSEHILTNQNIFDLDHTPARTLVIGSGPIGMEMGQALALLGSQVTIVSIDDTFARLEDPAIQPILEETFRTHGVAIELNAHIKSVEDQLAHFERKTGEDVTDTFTVPFDKVLIAIGRVPNLPKGLEEAGISYHNRGIEVDSQYRTSNRHVYAVGDIANRLQFTHMADDAARQIVTRVLSRGLFRVNNRKAVPKVTYTMPEVAQVGMSWEQAVATYGEDRLRRIEVPLAHNDRAQTDSATNGVLVVVARRINGIVLGAHMIGPGAGELITVFTLAIDRKISLWRLQSLIYAYPTYSLIIKKAADTFVGEQLQHLRTDLAAILRRNSPKLIAAFFWITLFLAFHQYRVGNDLTYAALLGELFTFFTNSIYGPLIDIVAYTIRPLIFFPATLLTALSGALFGFWWGVIYTIIGENASANLAYWIGRFFGKDARLEDSVLGNWVTALRQRPFGTVLFMRLFYVPFDLTNYGSGILKLPWLSYTMATLIGIMPGLVTFVALGASIDLDAFAETGLSVDIFDPRFLALSVGIFIVSLWLSRVLQRWHSTR